MNHGPRVFAVLEDVTNLFTHIRTARLSGDQNLITLLPQMGYQSLDVGGLSAAFSTLESDEFAFFDHFLEKSPMMIVPGSAAVKIWHRACCF